MNTQEMLRVLDSIARDRNIDREVLIQDLEVAMVSAARKHFNSLDAEEFTCAVDRLTGEMTMQRHGASLEMRPADFGRIAAQTFKQVMIQRFREDERNSLYEEFSGRVGEIVIGQVHRYEGGALVVMIDRAEAFMPRSEQIPGEVFAPGDRVRCLILDVRDVGNQVKIVLSRSHPDFIKKLFEVEVPEVAERIIEIKAMAREAGHRTKIAVSSIDSKVDAVGACVGVRGSRIKNIVDELNGEKIDIVRWNESSQILIQNALKPAIVSEISLCFELGRGTVVVQEDQLSLAIGKRGQNVRLAARLTGWDIDILTPDEFNKGLEIMADTLSQIEGVTEEMLDKLAALGIVSVFDVEEVGVDVLVNEAMIEAPLADQMLAAASAKAKIVAEQQEKDKAEAEVRKRAEEEAARRLMAGDLPADADADLRAAAILGAGAMERPTDPKKFDSLSGASDARAEAILSGAEPVEEFKEEAKKAPTEDDGDDESSDEDEGREIAENAVNEEMRRGASGA